MKISKIAIAMLLEYPWRFVSTTVAMALTAAIVLWVASTYQAIFQSFDEYANLAFGKYQLAIAPIDFESEASIPDEVLQQLRSDTRLQTVDSFWTEQVAAIDIVLPGKGEHSVEGPRGQLTYLFMATDSATPPHPMSEGEWIASFDTDGALVETTEGIVIREDIAKRWQIRLGDTIGIKTSGTTVELPVRGIISATLLKGSSSSVIHSITPSKADCFVTLKSAESFFTSDRSTHMVGVQVKEGIDLNAFRFDWGHQLTRFDPPVQFQHAFELEEQLDQSSAARNVQVQAYVAIAFGAFIAALAMIWGMNLGLESKIQQLGLMRAVGFTRGEVAMIPVVDGMLRGVVAWLLAMLIAVALQMWAMRQSGEIFRHGVPMQGAIWAAVSLFVGGCIAVATQLRLVLRVHPLDAIACAGPSDGSSDNSVSGWFDRRTVFPPTNIAAFVGALLLVVTAIITSRFGGDRLGETATSALVLFSLGGAFLLSVVALYYPFWTVCLQIYEWICPSRALLLKLQVMNIGARRPVVALALSSCMSLFLAIHIWGNTLLEAFVPGDWIPDAMAYKKGGITAEDLNAFLNHSQIDSKSVVGIRVEQVRLHEDVLGSQLRGTITRQDNVLVLGLDAAKVWGEKNPLLDCVWEGGNRSEAIEQLNDARGCVVVDHFLAESGLSIGDSIRIVPPRKKSKDYVEYKIVGALQLPGWHWQTKLTAMRSRSHRTAALIFVGDEVARRDFAADRYSHVWFNGLDRNAAKKNAASFSKGILGDWQSAIRIDSVNPKPEMRVVAAEAIRDQVRSMSKRWLWIVSIVPMVGMAVAMAGFIQMQIASLRSRSWEIGVVRSIGFQRTEVLGSWLIEVCLVIVFALVHSIAFGWLISDCAVHYTQRFSFFGGIDTPTRIPWEIFGWCFVFAAILIVAGVLAPARYLLTRLPMQLIASSVSWGRIKNAP